MLGFLWREQPNVSAIEVDAIEVLLVGILVGLSAASGKVDPTGGFVNAHNAPHNPIAFRNSVAQRTARAVIVVEVSPAVPLRVPDDIAIPEDVNGGFIEEGVLI